MSRTLTLKYQEAVHVTSFLRRLRGWDSNSFVRIQTRGKVVAFWGYTPMDCLAFIAVPLAEPREDDIDTVVFASRMRDIFGDLSHVTEENRLATYQLPDDMPPPLNLQDLPPTSGWVSVDQQTCAPLLSLVDDAIAEFHRQAAQLPNADKSLLDMIAREVWKAPGVYGFPLRGLHAARQLGFLSVANARAEFSTSGQWKRLSTPGGHLFFDTAPKRPQLRVLSGRAKA